MSAANRTFCPAEILLPSAGIQPETWACIACDQYTSQPEYWEKADLLVGNNPSSLRLILPECYLKESEERIPRIHAAMKDYLDHGILTTAVRNGFILCERTTASGTRVGLVGTVDLEAYDYTAGSLPLIRPTEQTIADRLPARLKIRRGAPAELSHILILIDDPDRTVLNPLQTKKASLKKLYDFDLMLNGGHLTGYAVEEKDDINHVETALENLRKKKGENPLLLAVGDGNHSLATAKAYWNEIRETLSPAEREHHPARFALCEIENLHDPALRFEPIHRMITGTWPEELYDCWEKYCDARSMVLAEEGTGHTFTMVIRKDEYPVVVRNPEGVIPCETIQMFLDEFIQTHPEASIDYIHGASALRMLAQNKRSIGFILPEISKKTFFEDVKTLGVLPRKTFSMGDADEKRFYLEAKRL